MTYVSGKGKLVPIGSDLNKTPPVKFSSEVREEPIMQVAYCNLAVVTVTAIFYVWRNYASTELNRQRVLRERVAYMLWVMAHEVA